METKIIWAIRPFFFTRFLVICTTANVNELAMTISTVWWYIVFLGLNPMYRPAYIWASGTKGVKSSMLVLNRFQKRN
jgi:hypothetical protein